MEFQIPPFFWHFPLLQPAAKGSDTEQPAASTPLTSWPMWEHGKEQGQMVERVTNPSFLNVSLRVVGPLPREDVFLWKF